MGFYILCLFVFQNVQSTNLSVTSVLCCHVCNSVSINTSMLFCCVVPGSYTGFSTWNNAGPDPGSSPFHAAPVSGVIAGSTWHIFGGVNGSGSTLLATWVELPGQKIQVIFHRPCQTAASPGLSQRCERGINDFLWTVRMGSPLQLMHSRHLAFFVCCRERG